MSDNEQESKTPPPEEEPVVEEKAPSEKSAKSGKSKKSTASKKASKADVTGEETKSDAGSTSSKKSGKSTSSKASKKSTSSKKKEEKSEEPKEEEENEATEEKEEPIAEEGSVAEEEKPVEEEGEEEPAEASVSNAEEEAPGEHTAEEDLLFQQHQSVSQVGDAEDDAKSEAISLCVSDAEAMADIASKLLLCIQGQKANASDDHERQVAEIQENELLNYISRAKTLATNARVKKEEEHPEDSESVTSFGNRGDDDVFGVMSEEVREDEITPHSGAFSTELPREVVEVDLADEIQRMKAMRYALDSGATMMPSSPTSDGGEQLAIYDESEPMPIYDEEQARLDIAELKAMRRQVMYLFGTFSIGQTISGLPQYDEEDDDDNYSLPQHALTLPQSSPMNTSPIFEGEDAYDNEALVASGGEVVQSRGPSRSSRKDKKSNRSRRHRYHREDDVTDEEDRRSPNKQSHSNRHNKPHYQNNSSWAEDIVKAHLSGSSVRDHGLPIGSSQHYR